MELKKIKYFGLDDCLQITNGVVELVVSIAVGPRILFYGFKGGQNLFRVFEDQITAIQPDKWQIYGGHRLWHAPEVFPRTYFPDNDPVEHEWDGESLRLRGRPEGDNNLRKEIEIHLLPHSSTVDLNHRIINLGPWDLNFAAWSLSVMAPGGTAIIPQEDFRTHSECLAPARPLVLWHFTRMTDSRFTWGDRYIRLKQDETPSELKFGVLNRQGWAAYDLKGELFVKLHDYFEGRRYPDFGSSAEFFTMPGFLEIETLSPLTSVAPGQCLSHRERWGLFAKNAGETEEEISASILSEVVDLKKGFIRE